MSLLLYTTTNIQLRLDHCHHTLVVSTKPKTYKTIDRYLRQLSIFTKANGDVKQHGFFKTTLSRAGQK